VEYHDISRFLYHEAALLDARRFEDWLDLFTEDAIYWVPAWNDDGSLTTDPQSEISLIYYDSKARLGERVWRIRSGMSAASNPLPRTTHLVTNIQVENSTIDQPLIGVSNAWQANSFSLTTQEITTFLVIPIQYCGKKAISFVLKKEDRCCQRSDSRFDGYL